MAASRRSTRAVAIALPSTSRSHGPPLAHPCQPLVPPPDLLDDAVRIGGPHERPRTAVVLGYEAVDRLLERHQGGETAAPEPLPGQLGKETFDGVEPGGGGRGEVEGPARVPL